MYQLINQLSLANLLFPFYKENTLIPNKPDP